MRIALRLAAAAALAVPLAGCGGGRSSGPALPAVPGNGLSLSASPQGGGGRCAPGTHTLQLVGHRTGLMRVTAAGTSGRRTLILSLHGAGDSPRGGLWIFRAAWSVPGLVILAPGAGAKTWSLRGADVKAIDQALKTTFARCRIDPQRVAIGGFSAGATLAVGLGLANGKLFHAVMALSPSSFVPAHRTGKPRVFVAHGANDKVIPIGAGGGQLAPELRKLGYHVTFDKFADGHAVPRTVSQAAVHWLLNGF